MRYRERSEAYTNKCLNEVKSFFILFNYLSLNSYIYI